MRLAQLLDRVHDEFPAVPELVALRALSDAAKEFCARSHAWQVQLDPVTALAGDIQTELEFDNGVMLAGIKDVRVDGRKVDAYPAEVPRRIRQALPPSNTPTGYIQHDPARIELVPALSRDAVLDVAAALTLVLGATNVELPDGLFNEYGAEIASGAKAKLVLQAAQPWYAPGSAMAYAVPFYAAINAAKRRAMTSLGAADMRVAMREWV